MANENLDPYVTNLNNADYVLGQAVNKLKNNESLDEDLLNLSYGQLVSKYGPDVANNAYKAYEGIQDAHSVDTHVNSTPTAIKDGLKTVGSAIVSTAGATASTATGLLSNAYKSGPYSLNAFTDPITDTLDSASVGISNISKDITGDIQDSKSQHAKNLARLDHIESILDSAKVEAEVNANPSGSKLYDDFRIIGKNFGNSLQRITNDPEKIVDSGLNALGSVIPISIGANVASKIGGGGKIAAGLGIGAVEASGSYDETLQRVLNTPKEVLITSPKYQNILQEVNGDEELALNRLATDTASEAFTKQLPIATVLGVAVSKFEKSPIEAYTGTNLLGKAKGIGLQGIEETGQEGTSKYTSNNTYINNIDPNASATNGVGEGAAAGAIGGIGLSSGLVAGNYAAHPIDTVLGIAKPVASVGLAVGAEAIKAGARYAGEKVNTSNKEEVSARDESINQIRTEIEDTINSFEPTETSQADPSLSSLYIPEETTEDNSVPTKFKTNIKSTDSLFDQTVGLVKKLEDKKVKFRDLSDIEVLYANNVFNKFKSVSDSLPDGLREKVQTLYESREIKAVNKLASNIDLNDVFNENTDINEDTIGATVSVAINTPENINPEFTEKLLNSTEASNLTDKEHKALQVSYKIGKFINNHLGNNLKITKGESIDFNTTTPSSDLSNVDKTSRSIQIDGLKRNGKKLRSVVDNVKDIIKVANSNGTEVINEDGLPINVKSVSNQLGMIATHLSNKVGAFNQSLANGDSQPVKYDSLYNGEYITPADSEQSAEGVFYNPKSKKSVRVANATYNDAVVTANIHNALLETYPEMFEDGTKPIKVPKLSPVTSNNATQNSSKETSNVDTQVTPESTDNNNSVDSLDNTSNSDTSSNSTATPTNDSSNLSTTSDGVRDASNTRNNKNKDVKNVNAANSDSNSSIDNSSSETNTNKQSNKTKPIKENTVNESDSNISSTTSPIPELTQEEENEKALYEAEQQEEIDQQVANELRTIDSVISEDISNISDKDIEETTDNVVEENTDLDQEVVEKFPADKEINIADTSPEFKNTYESKGKTIYSNVAELFAVVKDVVGESRTKQYTNYIGKYYGPLMKGLAARLDDVQYSSSKKGSVRDYLLNNTDGLNKIRNFSTARFKLFNLIDPATDLNKGVDKNGNTVTPFPYNRDLVGLAVVTFLDHISQVNTVNPRKPDQILEDLGLEYKDLSPRTKEDVGDMYRIMNGVRPTNLAEDIATSVMDVWNVKGKNDATVLEVRGIVEGIVKEIMDTAADPKYMPKGVTPLLEDADIPNAITKKDKITGDTVRVIETIPTVLLHHIPEAVENIGLSNRGLIKTLFNAKSLTLPSIGKKIKYVPDTVAKGTDYLSDLERNTVKNMQDAGSKVNKSFRAMLEEIGKEQYKKLMGYREIADEDRSNYPSILLSSIEGKNLSIEKDYNDLIEIYTAIDAFEETNPDIKEDTEVHYPVGVTKVKRHQQTGPNPQNNKTLRAGLSPSEHTIKLSSNERFSEDLHKFWIAVAQNADLYKIDTNSHEEILDNVYDKFTEKYGAIAENFKDFYLGKEEELNITLLDNLKEGEFNTELFNTLVEVGKLYALLESSDADTEIEFKTFLDVELDGKTDGSSNAIVHFRGGEIRADELSIYNGFGYFIGKSAGSLNDHFSNAANKALDLYENIAHKSNVIVSDLLGITTDNSKLKFKRDQLKRSMLFASVFGTVKQDENGNFFFSRNSAKPPTTKQVYGSGFEGISNGIAYEMLINFYDKMVKYNIPYTKEAIDKNFGIGMGEAIEKLFKVRLDGTFNEFNNASLENYKTSIKLGMGKILSDAASDTVGTKNITDTLLRMTSVQSEFIKRVFYNELNDFYEAKKSEAKANGTKYHRGDITVKEYKSLIKKVARFAPVYSNNDQDVSIGVIGKVIEKDLKLKLSSSLSDKYNQDSTVIGVTDAEVKAIPYVTMARGDAMVMNLVYGSENLSDVLATFDALHVPAGKYGDYSDILNKATGENWSRDVLGEIVTDYESFLSHAYGYDQHTLNEVLNDLDSKLSEGNPISYHDNLRFIKTYRNRALARKRAIAQFDRVIDHYAGKGEGYVIKGPKGEGTLEDINAEYRVQYDKIVKAEKAKNVVKEKKVKNHTVVKKDTVGNVLKNLKKVRDPNLRAIVKVVDRHFKNPKSTGLNKDTVIFKGPKDDVLAYLEENHPNEDRSGIESGEVGAAYITGENTIIAVENNSATLLHELLHATNYDIFLDHFNGTNPNAAVDRLVQLKDEFFGLDFSSNNANVQDAVNKLTTEINRIESTVGTDNNARALSEFVSWTLTNKSLIEKTKGTKTQQAFNIGKKMIYLLKKMLGIGNLPKDMYSHILFNSIIIAPNPKSEESGNSTGIPDVDIGIEAAGFDSSQVPPDKTNKNEGKNNNVDKREDISKFATSATNYWVRVLKDRISQNKDIPNKYRYPDEYSRRNENQLKIGSYERDAKDIVDNLKVGGFHIDEAQEHLFKTIYTVIAFENKQDASTARALNDVYKHIIANLTPNMLGSNEKYQSLLDTLSSADNNNGLGIIIGLTLTNSDLRTGLEQVVMPETVKGKYSTADEAVNSAFSGLMSKVVDTVDVSGKEASKAIEELAESLIQLDVEAESNGIRKVLGYVGKSNTYVSEKIQDAAKVVESVAESYTKSSSDNLTKNIVGSVGLVAQLVDKTNASIAVDRIQHLTSSSKFLDKFVPFRELVTELIGVDKTTQPFAAALDKVNASISRVRQAHIEVVPKVLQDSFKNKPDKDTWKKLHTIIGKNSFSSVFDISKPEQSINLLIEEGGLNKRITGLENKINKAFGDNGKAIIEDANKLSNFMLGKGVTRGLKVNPYAINKLNGNYIPEMDIAIERLVSLYNVRGTDKADRKLLHDLYKSEPEAVRNIITYTKGLGIIEDSKNINEVQKLNGVMGYIPDTLKKGTKIIIANVKDRRELEAKGYTYIKEYNMGSNTSRFEQGYFVSTLSAEGFYSQGIIQHVRESYKGVNTNGHSVDPSVSGSITSPESIKYLNKVLKHKDNINAPLIPKYNDKGDIFGYEKYIDPEILDNHGNRESHLGVMLGKWAGRQIEEEYAQQFNTKTIDKLKEVYDARNTNDDSLYVNIADPNLEDPIYKDSWNSMSPETREYAEKLFGEDTFYIRKDMINISVGYRQASILDAWSGKTRLNKETQSVIKDVVNATLGYKTVGKLENVYKSGISTIKDVIVIRSLIVPIANTQANVVQLINNEVNLKHIGKGYRDGLTEIEVYNKNSTDLIRLETQIGSTKDEGKINSYKAEIKRLNAENQKLSIYPLIEAGAYKNISEGFTEVDSDLLTNDVAKWVDGKIDSIPNEKVKTIAKYGLLSKDTAIYKKADKLVQYGDFLAKTIYYKHLVEVKGVDPTEALSLVSEEFVNFSLPAGRSRDYVESVGGTWFFAFKLRIMRIALRQMRDHPVSSLLVGNTIGEYSGSPISDNIGSVIADGRLDYSLGPWDMISGGTTLNPWVNLFK